MAVGRLAALRKEISMSSTRARRILITGATRGLGRAMTDGFIEEGHIVVGCGTNAAAVDELSARYGRPHVFQTVDVADDHQVRRWSAEVDATGDPIDLLINNAAVMNHPAPLWQVSADEFDRLIRININGVVNVIRHFLPGMVARQSGVVVNFSSGWGRSVDAQVAPYCASKWAIEGLTRALAEELPAGMAAVPLNPGVIDTDMLRTAWGDSAGSYKSPRQWAQRAVPFLLKIGPRENGQPLTVK
jgi:NAD(P)-dependent dehydrogenase (short-subunit alcohol dehydrogenase family)